jgi:hypothetical protein
MSSHGEERQASSEAHETEKDAGGLTFRRTLVRILIVPIVVAALAGGFYVISRSLPTGGVLAIGAGAAWVAAAAGAFAWVARRDRVALRMVVGAAVLTVFVGGYLIRPRATEVDEQIVTAAPPSSAAGAARGGRDPGAPSGPVQVLSGRFGGESGHSGEGKAAVVKLPDGARKLTFRDFDVDPGAGRLRVYLAAGRPASDAAVTDFIDLAALKGTRGKQQYDIPRDLNLRRYGTVVVWCVPFTTRIAQAPLS